MEKQEIVASTLSGRKRNGELVEPVSENTNLLGISGSFRFHVARAREGVGPDVRVTTALARVGRTSCRAVA